MKYVPNIIIDDASHKWSDQILSLVRLFPTLSSGGIYIIEDIGTSFSSFIDSYENDASIRCYEFLSLISEAVAGNLREERNRGTYDGTILDAASSIAKETDLISFIHGSVILLKS